MSLSREERTQVFTLIHTEHGEQIIRAIKHLNVIKEEVSPESIIDVLPALRHTINTLASLEMMPDLKEKAPTIRAFFQSYIRQVMVCLELAKPNAFEQFVQLLEKNWGRTSLVDICIVTTCNDKYPTTELLSYIPDSNDVALKTKVHALDLCFHLSGNLLEKHSDLAGLRAKIFAIAKPVSKQVEEVKPKNTQDPAALFEKFFGGGFNLPKKDNSNNNNNNLPKKK